MMTRTRRRRLLGCILLLFLLLVDAAMTRTVSCQQQRRRFGFPWTTAAARQNHDALHHYAYYSSVNRSSSNNSSSNNSSRINGYGQQQQHHRRSRRPFLFRRDPRWSAMKVFTAIPAGGATTAPEEEEQQQQQQENDSSGSASASGTDSPYPTGSTTNSGTFLKPEHRKDSDDKNLPWKRNVLGLKEHVQNLQTRMAGTKSVMDRWTNLMNKSNDGADGDNSSSSAGGPWSALASTLAAALGSNSNDVHGGPSFLTLYLTALLGSSIGFYLFLYFISVGYAVGVALPVLAALVRHWPTASPCARLHAGLVVLWGARLATFLLWREHRNWPALHAQVVRVHKTQAPSALVKVLYWVVYSFLYVCVGSPVWFRLQQSSENTKRLLQAATESATTTQQLAEAVTTQLLAPTSWGTTIATWLGIGLQCSGLLLESVADWQKSRFKASTSSNSGNGDAVADAAFSPDKIVGDGANTSASTNTNLITHRNDWCHDVGVWKYSTHPNYAGEWIFWCGTWLAGLPGVFGGGSGGSSERSAVALTVVSSLLKLLVATAGLVFISTVLRGAVTLLQRKQYQKYGNLPRFVAFQQRYGVFGPKSSTVREGLEGLWLRAIALASAVRGSIKNKGKTSSDPSTVEAAEGPTIITSEAPPEETLQEGPLAE